MEQLAPRYQALKRHEASSCAPELWKYCDEASFADVWTFLSNLFSCRCASATAGEYQRPPLVTSSSGPKDVGPRQRQEALLYDTDIIATRKGETEVVAHDGRGFRFFAATRDFNDHIF